MKYLVVCVRDRAAVAYGVPNFVLSRGAAIRSFADEINRAAPDNMLYLHPDDFDMFYLGVYDGDTGEFVCTAPEQIAVGKDLKVSKPNGSA